MKDRGQGTYALNTSVQLNRQIVSDVSCIKSRDSSDSIWRHKIKYLLIQRWGVPAWVPLNTATTAIHELLHSAGIHKMPVRIANREDPDQIASLGAVLSEFGLFV